MSSPRPIKKDLKYAVTIGNYKLARHLIEDCKVDPDTVPITDFYKESILELATSPLQKSLKGQANCEKLLDLLLKAGINLDKNDGGKKALLQAISPYYWVKNSIVKKLRINIVNKILDRKIDINSVLTGNGHTALILAAGYGHKEVCQLLLSRGASLCCKMTNYNNFHTAISLALLGKQFPLAEELLDHAIKQAKEGKCDLKVAIGPSVLFVYHAPELLSLLKKLLSNKADVDAKDYSGRNALDCLFEEFGHPQLNEQQVKELMILFLEAGIDTASQYKNETVLALLERRAKMGGGYGSYVGYYDRLLKVFKSSQKRKLLSDSLDSLLFKPLLFKPLVRIVDEYAADSDGEDKPSLAFAKV